MKLLVLCLTIAVAAAQLEIDTAGFDAEEIVAFQSFQNWTHRFSKSYQDPAEYMMRFNIFKKNVQRIEELRAEHESDASERNAQFGLTQFSDMTFDEFKQTYLHFEPKASVATRKAMHVTRPISMVALPNNVDWRTTKKVTAVKNQGQCGSCWAFSATEELESAWAMQTGQLITLSEQQTVSCDTVDGGCGGGDTITAYQYIEQANGVATEANYPYQSGGGTAPACADNPSEHVLTVTNYSYATPGCQDACDHQDETTLASNLAAHGPVSICVNANDAWQMYTGGVLSSGCSHAYSDLDHCVQLVGYNRISSPSYWLVRNSWDVTWGEAGYIRIQMGSNLCGIADEATLVTAAHV